MHSPLFILAILCISKISIISGPVELANDANACRYASAASAAESQSNRVKKGPRSTYASKRKIYTGWIKKHFPEHFDNDSNNIYYPVDPDVWMAFSVLTKRL